MPLLPERIVKNEFLEADESDILDCKARLFHNFALQGMLHGLAKLDMPARDAVFVVPLMRLQQEDFAFRAED